MELPGEFLRGSMTPVKDGCLIKVSIRPASKVLGAYHSKELSRTKAREYALELLMSELECEKIDVSGMEVRDVESSEEAFTVTYYIPANGVGVEQ